MVATKTAPSGGEPGLATFDIEEFFGPEIGAETGLGHHVVRKFQRRSGGNHRIAAVRDIGERAAMDKRRVAFERLHQIRLQGILEQRGHRPLPVELARAHRFALSGVADNDISEPGLQIGEILRQAKYCHDLAGDGDVETVFARKAVGDAAQRSGDRAQRAVVHIDDTAPTDAANIDAESVAPVNVIVDQRREQIIGDADGVKVTGEMEIDVLHRHHLGEPAAGGAAFHAEARP